MLLGACALDLRCSRPPFDLREASSVYVLLSCNLHDNGGEALKLHAVGHSSHSSLQCKGRGCGFGARVFVLLPNQYHILLQTDRRTSVAWPLVPYPFIAEVVGG